ncbi:dipeptidyl-peptidase 3 [Verticillium dahliae]
MTIQEIQVFRLQVKDQFERLKKREKRYAHHMARAAWCGARIILRQVSPESSTIFDFILELHRTCAGAWTSLVGPGVSNEDLQRFLVYAATFLSNIGNYYGSGDQKFIPDVDRAVLQKLAEKSPTLTSLYQEIAESMTARPPFSLGYPSETAQSAYYPGDDLTDPEIAMVSKLLELKAIFPENTRIQRSGNGASYEVLLAAVERGEVAQFPVPDGKGTVNLVRGDHSSDLQRVCAELTEASKYAANDLQRTFLNMYIKSFQTGSLDMYRESQRTWVRDKAPRVENIFGFVEPYRDPHGVRAEFEAIVAIADAEETKLLAELVEKSTIFIRRLPWATQENGGKGPFEKDLFEPPDISSIHALAYCSSIIFPGINLPNVGHRLDKVKIVRWADIPIQYNDIRQEDGFKNVIIANRMAAESQAEQYPFINASEAEQFKKHKFPAYYWWVVLHELLGHGTGRMMIEDVDGKFNFDIKNPPVNPINEEPITCWYKPGQTWTGQFGDPATTVDECRAELVGAYLMDDPELLDLLGFTETSEISAKDCEYLSKFGDAWLTMPRQ